MVGRLDPETGESKTVTVPTPKSNPYGMVDHLQGRSLLCRVRRKQNRQHRSRNHGHSRICICRTKMPGLGASRSLTDDILYYTDYGRGYLGQFNTNTGKMTKEWLFSQRPEIAALRNHDRGWHRLVQRIGHEAEHARALRSQDREIPDLVIPGGRRRGAEYDALRGRQTRAHRKRGKCGGAGHREERG